jgi:hypothetical protein
MASKRNAALEAMIEEATVDAYNDDELGCEIGIESGQLAAILVKGTAKANLKIALS